MKKTINIFGYVVIGFLLIFLLFVTIYNLTGKTFFIGNRTILWVKTGSMEPAIEEKSYILVEKADVKNLKVGDVITFYSPDPVLKGQYNTHRIIEIIGDNDAFITKGDNNPGQDQYSVKADMVVARYVRNLSFLTMLGRFLMEPIGLIAILMLIVITIILVFLPDIRGRLKKEEKNAAIEKDKLIQERILEEVKRLEEENKKGGTK